MKTILGIDPGLACIGYGVIRFDGYNYHHVTHGTIKTIPKHDTGTRLVQIYQGIKEIIIASKPDEAAVETLYFARNIKSAIPVAQARGVVLFALAEQDIVFKEYTPLEIKQAVIGRGRAEKFQIQEILKILFKLPDIPKPDHAADALAAAFCHANRSTVMIKC